MSRHSILTCWVSPEKSAATLKGVPCRFFVWIFSCYFFVSLVWLICFSLGLSCVGLCASWTCLIISCPMLVKFLTIIASNIFSGPFSSSSGTLIIQMLVHLMSSQRSLRLPHLVSFFFFILLCFSYFHHSVFQLTMCSSASVFCSWFFLVYASFQLSFCSSLIACSLVLEELEFFFFNKNKMFLLNISYIFPIWASTSETLHHLSYHFCVFFFRWSATSLHCLLEFYLIPPSGAYSSAISLCLILCDCSFCSAGCRLLFLLLLCSTHLVYEAKRLAQAFCLAVTGFSPLVGYGMGVVPLVCWAVSRDVFRGQAVCSERLCSLSANGWDCSHHVSSFHLAEVS